MCPGNFHQLDFTIKSHHLDSIIGSVFNLRHLFTRICIDNPFWRHPKTLYQLYFSLKKRYLHYTHAAKKWKKQKNMGSCPSSPPNSLTSTIPETQLDLPCWEHQGHVTESFRVLLLFAYLAGTVKSCPNSSEGLHYGSAIIAFDCIKGGDPRKCF